VVQEALLIPWQRRADFVRALAVPLALLAGFYLAWYLLDEPARQITGWTAVFLCWLAFAILFALFAVTVHRLVLLDSRPLRGIPLPAWSMREARFVLFILLIWAIYLAVWWVVLLIAGNLLPRGWFESSLQPVEIAARLPALYIIARLSLVFPATAIDRNAGLKWAWRASRGNGWRLVVVVTVLPWMVSQLFGLLYRDEPSTAEVVLLTVVGTALFALEIAALSVAYRELAGNEP